MSDHAGRAAAAAGQQLGQQKARLRRPREDVRNRAACPRPITRRVLRLRRVLQF